jgi:hypothetical protein
MLNLVARIKDQVVVIPPTDQTMDSEFLKAVAINYGGAPEDYIIYQLTAEEEVRVDNGDEFILKWDGDKIVALDFSIEDAKGWLSVTLTTQAIKVTLNSVDIAKVKIPTGDPKESFVQGDLVFKDNSVVQCQVASDSTPSKSSVNWSVVAPAILVAFNILLPDKKTIDITANFTDSLDVRLPGRSAKLTITIVNGVCSIPMVFNSLDNCGEWTIPADSRVVLNGMQYKVIEQQVFNGFLPY